MSSPITIYLAGPINGRTDSEATDWREALKRAVLDAWKEPEPIVFLDPMRRDYRGREDDHVEDLVLGDKADVGMADVFAAYCHPPSFGTAMELYLAWSLEKRRATFVPIDVSVSPWVAYHGGFVSRHFDQFVDTVVVQAVEFLHQRTRWDL